MKQAEQIEHKGIIKDIIGRKLDVSIIPESACAKCSVKGSCSVSEEDEKIIEVYVDNPNDYKNGEEVEVFYQRSLGFRALFLGYLMPFLILIVSLITLTTFTQNELLSGMVSLLLLFPYYLTLYLSKDKIKKTFRFSIKKSLNFQSITFVRT